MNRYSFYFTVVETNLTEYCTLELIRYLPNATLKIDYGDGSNETINLIGGSKDFIGYLIRNDLNINETMNNNLVDITIRPKYDFYNFNDYQDTFETTNNNPNFSTTAIALDSSTTISDSFTPNQTDQNFQNNEYNNVSFYFTGILFQHIQFDVKYWLNGFEFESSNNGKLKIGVKTYIYYYYLKIKFYILKIIKIAYFNFSNPDNFQYPIKFAKNITSSYTINVIKGLNKYYLANRVLVEPANTIYCETNDSGLINFLLINKNETAYYSNKISDLLILNQTHIYEIDQSYSLMFSIKTNLDYYEFYDKLRLSKVYNLPGYYAIQMQYKDALNDLTWTGFKLNVTSSINFFFS